VLTILYHDFEVLSRGFGEKFLFFVCGRWIGGIKIKHRVYALFRVCFV